MIAVLWSLVVALLMLLPSSSVEAAVSGWPALLEIPSLDKILHAGSFGLVAWLWFRALGESQPGILSNSLWLLLLLGTIAYGALLEGAQSFSPTRATQWTDILANSLGAAFSLALSLAFSKRGYAAGGVDSADLS